MESRSVGLTAFGQFLRRDHEILHFACHAIQRDPMAASFLRVDDGFDIPQLQFAARRFVVGGDPVVTLNACRTSNAHPLHTFNRASHFLGRGARGVLATEFRVPDTFASEFAQDFYVPFMAGVPIGRAVRAARKSLGRLRSEAALSCAKCHIFVKSYGGVVGRFALI
jgi:CHAT domain-containing protein